MPYIIGAPPFFGQAIFSSDITPAGWSEGYWLDPDPATYSGALALLHTLMIERKKMLTTDYRIDVIKVSKANVKGDVFPRVYGTSMIGTYPVAATLGIGQRESLPPDNALIYRLFARDNSCFSNHYFRGLPAEQITPGTVNFWQNNTAWTSRVDPFLTLLHDKCQLVTTRPVGADTSSNPKAVAIGAIIFDRIVHRRKAGRPFGLLRGRLAAR